MLVIHWILLSIHILASAAWFGAMFYSLLVLHPRAKQLFGRGRKFEEFIAFIANGARWPVLSGIACIAVTGAILMIWFPNDHSMTWKICNAVKIFLLALATAIFCFGSWKLWPARIICSDREIPKFQKQFRLIAITLLILVVTATVLGVVVSAHLK